MKLTNKGDNSTWTDIMSSPERPPEQAVQPQQRSAASPTPRHTEVRSELLEYFSLPIPKITKRIG